MEIGESQRIILDSNLQSIETKTSEIKTAIEELQTIDIPSIKEDVTSIKEDNKTNTTTIINNTAGLKMDIINLNKQMLGEASPYGTGSWGDVEYDADTFNWGSKDYYGRYVIQCTSLYIPEGQTMTPPEKCNGVYILCQGDVIIDGNIDTRQKRSDYSKKLDIVDTFVINNTSYTLAKGGNTVKGGKGGKGGDCDSYTGGSGGSGDSLLGDHIGGGIPTQGLGGSGATTYSSYPNNYDKNGSSGGIKYGEAPCSIIIISGGKINISGNITARGTDGSKATDGSDGYSRSSGCSNYYYGGTGGNGAMSPSGGAGVTIIATNIDITGSIDTRPGKKLISSSGSKGADAKYSAKGGNGGSGGTFMACAGEIKIYKIGEVA